MPSMALNIKALTGAVMLLLPAVQGKSAGPLVGPVPKCATKEQLLFQPVMDFDLDTCYHAPAVDTDGKVNPGQDTSYDDSPSENCRDKEYLQKSNVYVRSRCNNSWCGHLYAYYAETDRRRGGGHRHDLEHVVVFAEHDGDSVHPRYVATSAHGGYTTKKADDALQTGGHFKVVYHKDGGATHAMRFAKEDGSDEPPENHLGEWFTGDLVSYYGFPSSKVRDAMMNNDWGKAKWDFSDERFVDSLKSAMGDYKDDIPLDVNDTNDDTSKAC